MPPDRPTRIDRAREALEQRDEAAADAPEHPERTELPAPAKRERAVRDERRRREE